MPATAASDPDLLARFAAGNDPRAFEALVRRHGPNVLGVCRRVTGDPHAAEDAFQATFLVLARKGGTLARPEALGSWLYGVAARVAAKARRAKPTPLPAALPAADPDPAERELVRILDEEIGRLPDVDRDLIVAVYLDGRTHDEAARRAGCPLGSVAYRLDRARHTLRVRLVGRGVTMAVGALLLLASFGRAAEVPEPLVRDTTAAARRRKPGPVWAAVAVAAMAVAALAVSIDRHLHAGGPPPEPVATAAADPPADHAGCHRH